ncbi:MAG: glycosyltransferase [Thermoguttaceae bacterium]
MNKLARRLAHKLCPPDTRRSHWARAALHRLRHTHRTTNHAGLEQVLRETRGRKGIVIYPPFIDWTWMRQRPHQLMAQFAEAGYLSLFCSPLYKTDSFRGFVRVAPHLYLSDSLSPLYDLQDAILLISWTGHWQTTKRFHRPTVIYDYLDDLSVSANGGEPSQLKLEEHRKAVMSSEIVLATAAQLYEEVRQLRSDALYCPNGVDYDHFHRTERPAVPSDMADLVATGRPILGYYGALARWFDYDLVVHAALARPDWQFLLIGPDLDGTVAGGRLGRASNIRWLREKPYEDLPAYLSYFDAAMIPFLVDDITRATSPIKLFEYLAGTKPVVTTDLPECRNRNGVLVGHNPDEYVAMLGQAIERGREESFRQILDEESRRHTWRSRAEQIIERLNDLRGVNKQRRSA